MFTTRSTDSAVSIVGALILAIAPLTPGAVSASVFGWECGFVACGDWSAADAVCGGAGRAQEMTCDGSSCEEGGNNLIHCAS
jgi:hypothetical protein